MCPLARDPTLPCLALDQPEALLGQDEQIDLVNGPVIGLELEIGPRPVRIVVGQTGRMKSRASRSFVLRRSDDFPAWRFHAHLLPTAIRLHAAHHLLSVAVAGAQPYSAPHRDLPAETGDSRSPDAGERRSSRRFPVAKGIRRHAEVVRSLGDPEIIPQLGHTTTSPEH